MTSLVPGAELPGTRLGYDPLIRCFFLVAVHVMLLWTSELVGIYSVLCTICCASHLPLQLSCCGYHGN